MSGLLDRILADEAPAFALLHRPESAPGVIDVLIGDVSRVDESAGIPLPEPGGTAGHQVLALIPYRQIAERGYAAPDDGEPLLALRVADQDTVTLDEARRRLPRGPIPVSAGAFDLDDAGYADTVRRIVADEIGEGEGANFVIKRTFTARIEQYGPAAALAFFGRLLERESGAYWTFLVHTGERTLVGATPERHVSLEHGTAVMNPISGTYRYPPAGPTLDGVLDFLADRKESEELYMVVDEELKMMARVCEGGGRVVGPYLKQMARLAHTEYFIEGRSHRDVREILRETMFAPTVTGSPVESAARVIAKYEPEGRGYYSGVAALIGQDAAGARRLDSAILIRTADIAADGRMRIGVGATLVRHSDPDGEAAETRAKAAGLLAALGDAPEAQHEVDTSAAAQERPADLGDHPAVRAALARRNQNVAGFWIAGTGGPAATRHRGLAGLRTLVIDAEDTFTEMIACQLRSLGLEVTVRRFDEPYAVADHDLVVMGPGPGDPREHTRPKIAHLRAQIKTLLEERRPFLAVCLSHQVLSTLLDFELVRRPVPNQGVQRRIELFGAAERVGFYNTFAARAEGDSVPRPGVGEVEVSRDARSGEVHALRGPGFASIQFHAESVLTVDGPRILGGLLAHVLRSSAHRTDDSTRINSTRINGTRINREGK